MEAMPIATPMMKRPISRVVTSAATADASEPTMKRQAVAMMTRRRPKRSEMEPAKTAPTVAPAKARATIAPCMPGLRWKTPLMKRSAPEMTPVS